MFLRMNFCRYKKAAPFKEPPCINYVPLTVATQSFKYIGKRDTHMPRVTLYLKDQIV